MLLFGDIDGNIILSDRNFKLLWKHKAFKGEVKGVAYIYDAMSHHKQYIYAVGDEFIQSSNSNDDNENNEDTHSRTAASSSSSASSSGIDSHRTDSTGNDSSFIQESFYMLKVRSYLM